MQEKQEIILQYFREGLSLRSISRRTGFSRKTVSRYVKQHSDSKEEVYKENFVTPPKYDTSNRQPRVLTSEICQIIDGYLEQNRQRRMQGQTKQCLLGKDIHEQLILQGIQISYSTVCDYIKKQKTRVVKEAFIRQSSPIGAESEFDWGEVKLWIKDQLITFQMAVFTSCYSNHRFGKLYLSQDTLNFQQSHADYFNFIGGAFKGIVYDNMRVAVKELAGERKKPTKGLEDLSRWYGFDFRFCNFYSGNEKGHVERSVEYLRRKVFSIRDRFDSLEEANAYFESECIRLNNKKVQGQSNSIIDNFEKERPHLISFSESFPCQTSDFCKVGKYSTISYKTNHYSVPDHLVGRQLELRIMTDKLTVFDGKQCVCNHPLGYGKYEWYLELDHYLSTMLRKPGSVKNSTALIQSDMFYQKLFKDHFNDNPRDFIGLLQYAKEKDIDKQTLEYLCDASLACSGEISLSKLKTLHHNSLMPAIEEKTTHDPIFEHCIAQLKTQSEFINLQTTL